MLRFRLRSCRYLLLIFATAMLLAGCPKRNQDFAAGIRAEEMEDYDTAIVYFERALRASPKNAEYKLWISRARFEAGKQHIQMGRAAAQKSDLQGALAEFERAQAIDPSNPLADQEAKHVLDRLAEARRGEAQTVPGTAKAEHQNLLTGPPVLKPLSLSPVNLKMSNDCRIVFETVAKLSGLGIVFDPDLPARRISVDLSNVSLEQALDAVAFESKTFWAPLTSNIIMVAPDQPQKRREMEEQVIQTFYLSNTTTPQELTEIVTGLRQLLDLKRVQQVNAENAIVIRDTPDKMEIVAKVLRDLDQARPEILLEVSVLQASLDRLRDLGVLPGQTIKVSFTPRASLTPNNSSSSNCGTSNSNSSCSQITLNNLKHLSTDDFSVTLPGATANMVLTDSATRIIQDPEIRVSDGQKAALKIGDRVPVATGSFSSGVGSTGTGSNGISPLVNTQFQYIDVGVNIDVTPRVHPGNEVSLKMKIEVSSVTGTATIGGINQPIISQRTVDHDIRLKDGEASILGGLLQRTETNSVNGWPGLANLPFFRYFFSDNSKQVQDSEVLIMVTPHVIRMQGLTAENFRRLATGTDTNIRVFHGDKDPIPATSSTSLPAGSIPTPVSAVSPATTELHFDPAAVTLHAGETANIALAVSGASELFSIPLLLQYDPAVVQIEEVANGGFLSAGSQEIAIVQQVDREKGLAIISATRQPHTSGVNGNGTLLGIVLRGVAPGKSALKILQTNARDSQQKSIAMTAGEAFVQVN